MLSLKRHTFIIILALALVISTSAYAGLYGFTQTENQPQAEQLRVPPRHISNYRKSMRDLFISLATYGKSTHKDFQILVHEGQYLLNKSLWEYDLDSYNKIRRSKKTVKDDSFLSIDIPEYDEDSPSYVSDYINVIDGIAVNNHYCGQNPIDSLIYTHDLSVFALEKCDSEEALDRAIIESFRDKNVIYPFLYTEQAFRRLNHQLIINETADSVLKLKDAHNIGFLLEDSAYDESFIALNEIRNSNYDVVVVHPFFHREKPYSKEEVDAMKFKKNGGRRLILALYNISETSEEDYFWQKKWLKKLPNWIAKKSPTNIQSYIVKYWTPEWKMIASRYFKGIVDSGYDGVFITGLENHLIFEENKPLE